MSSFRDEINQIMSRPAQKVITNDTQTKLKQQKQANKYIDEICIQIKKKIKAEAFEESVRYDKKLTGFWKERWVDCNPHYMTNWHVGFEINFCEEEFGQKTVCVPPGPYGEWSSCPGFVVNDFEMIDYILSSVTKKLQNDEIYAVESRQMGQYSHSPIKTVIDPKIPKTYALPKFQECLQRYQKFSESPQSFEINISFAMFI